MPSIIRGSDNLDSAAAASLKAWVNFNGVTTAAIRASYNVTSVTRVGAGQYTINFTNAMADTNYAAIGNTGLYSSDSVGAVAATCVTVSSQTTSSVTVLTVRHSSNNVDFGIVNVAVYR